MENSTSNNLVCDLLCKFSGEQINQITKDSLKYLLIDNDNPSETNIELCKGNDIIGEFKKMLSDYSYKDCDLFTVKIAYVYFCNDSIIHHYNKNILPKDLKPYAIQKACFSELLEEYLENISHPIIGVAFHFTPYNTIEATEEVLIILNNVDVRDYN